MEPLDNQPVVEVGNVNQENIQAVEPLPMEFKKAGWWTKYWAFIFDSLYFGIFIFIIILPLLLLGVVSRATFNDSHILNASGALMFLTYNVYFLSKKGKTPGKESFGIRVISLDGSIPPVKNIIIREFIKSGILVIPVIGNIFYLVNSLVTIFTKRGFHDRFSKTVEIKFDEKKPTRLTRFAVAILMLPSILAIFALLGISYMFFFNPFLKS